jgi:hypothetical protein
LYVRASVAEEDITLARNLSRRGGHPAY